MLSVPKQPDRNMGVCEYEAIERHHFYQEVVVYRKWFWPTNPFQEYLATEVVGAISFHFSKFLTPMNITQDSNRGDCRTF